MIGIALLVALVAAAALIARAALRGRPSRVEAVTTYDVATTADPGDDTFTQHAACVRRSTRPTRRRGKTRSRSASDQAPRSRYRTNTQGLRPSWRASPGLAWGRGECRGPWSLSW